MSVDVVLDMSDLLSEERVKRPFSLALHDVIDALAGARIQYALVGGLAAGKLGRIRATQDIDIAVTSRRGVARALSSIADRVLPFFDLGDGESMTKFVHTESGVEIDVLVLSSPAGRLAVEAAEPARLTASLHARLPPLEALLCLKLVASLSPAREPEKRLTDEADIIALLRRHGSKLDRGLLGRLIDGLSPSLARKARRKQRSLERVLADSARAPGARRRPRRSRSSRAR